MTIEPVAYIRTEFPEKFGIPRQSGLASELLGCIVFEEKYRNPDALRGLEDFEYIWLIWEFSANSRNKNEWQPLVRPPRLGGNKTMGVFATRSPFRPNRLGLSSVKIDRIIPDGPEGPEIWVRGADLMDGTPIYDIKPYIGYADSHSDAKSGFVDNLEERMLDVVFPEDLKHHFSHKRLESLIQVLSLDPRPSYQNDPERCYGLSFDRYNIHFRVSSNVLTVTDIEEIC